MKRTIKYLVVHCTATPPEAKVENIVRYWKEQKGWKNPGYHYIIRRNGEIVQLLSEDLVANGVKNYNQPSIHISYIGGIDSNNKPFDNRTQEQQRALYLKLRELAARYPLAEIKGHRDFPGVTKACPSFDVKAWLRNYTPD
jgi:N-acetylmuramoyl-L-alanine amidase